MASPGPHRVGHAPPWAGPPAAPSGDHGPMSEHTMEAIRRVAIDNPALVHNNLFHLFEGLQGHGLAPKQAWEAVSPVLHALQTVSKAATAKTFLKAMSDCVALALRQLQDHKRPYFLNWLSLTKEAKAVQDQLSAKPPARAKGKLPKDGNPSGSWNVPSIHHMENGGYYQLADRPDQGLAITALTSITDGVLAVGTAKGYVSIWGTAYTKLDNPIDKGELYLIKAFKAHSRTTVTAMAALHVPSQLQSRPALPGARPAQPPAEGPVFLTCSAAGVVKAWRLIQTVGYDRTITYSVAQLWALRVDGPVVRLATAAASCTWAVITQTTPVSSGALQVFTSDSADPPSLALTLSMPDPGGLALMPDGHIVIFSVGSVIHVYQVKPCMILATLKEHEKHVSCLAVTRNGSCLLSGTSCYDGKAHQPQASCSIKVWDLQLTNGQQRVTLRQTIRKAHEGGVVGMIACTNDCDMNMVLSYGMDIMRLTSNNPKPVSWPLTFTRGDGCGVGVEGSWQKGWKVIMTTPAATDMLSHGTSVRIYSIPPGQTFPTK